VREAASCTDESVERLGYGRYRLRRVRDDNPAAHLTPFAAGECRSPPVHGSSPSRMAPMEIRTALGGEFATNRRFEAPIVLSSTRSSARFASYPAQAGKATHA